MGTCNVVVAQMVLRGCLGSLRVQIFEQHYFSIQYKQHSFQKRLELARPIATEAALINGCVRTCVRVSAGGKLKCSHARVSSSTCACVCVHDRLSVHLRLCLKQTHGCGEGKGELKDRASGNTSHAGTGPAHGVGGSTVADCQ